MRDLDKDEEVKEDGQPLPAKVPANMTKKKPAKKSTSYTEAEQLHGYIKEQMQAGRQGTIDHMWKRQRQ